MKIKPYKTLSEIAKEMLEKLGNPKNLTASIRRGEIEIVKTEKDKDGKNLELSQEDQDKINSVRFS